MGAIRYIIICLTVLAFGSVQAQDPWEKNDQQSMESMVFDVVGDKEIKLPQAVRIFEPVPPQPYERINPELSYQFGDYFYGASPVVLRLRPRPLAAQAEEKLYGNYVKGGFGNYGTPYADVYLTSKRQREYSYGVRFNLLNSLNGPVDDRNSGAGTLGAAVFGGAYGDQASLTGSAKFTRDNLHFYGYVPGSDVEPGDIEQFFNRIKLNARLYNTRQDTDFQYKASVNLVNMTDSFSAKETALESDVETSLQVMDEAWMDIDAGVQSITRNDPNFTGENRLHFYGVGGLKYLKDKLLFSAMLRFDYLNDTLAKDNGVKIFPVVKVKYSLTEDIIVTGGLDGGVNRLSLSSAAAENPFIQSGLYLSHAVKQLGLNGKVSGILSPEFGVSAGFEYSRLKNSSYFVNSMSDQARFDIVYDSAIVNLFNPFFSLDFNRDEMYRAGLRADYFGYSMGLLDQPWHRPRYQISVNTDLLFVEKIRVTTNISYVGGIIAFEGGGEKELDPFLDLNLGIEYLAGSRMSIFLNGGNLLGKNYQRFNNYPVKGIQVLGGVSYKF